MADLDDFFAKKDKRKSKPKKFTASDLLSAKTNDDVALSSTPTGVVPKKAEKKREEGPSDVADGNKSKAPSNEEVEDEWAEFEEEKEKDYSGLKIQRLQIQDSDEDDGQNWAEPELDEEGEPVKKESSGPWNKLVTQPTIPAQQKESEQTSELPNTSGGVYIPPIKRMQQNPGSAARHRTGKKGKEAPDLKNEEFFPSLSQAVEQTTQKTRKQMEQMERGFVEAKPSRSHTSRGIGSEDGLHLNLGNKFHALSNEDI